jgi:ferredoxin
MGHVAGKQAYLDLQQRLDRMPIGAPAHRALIEILETLFSEEECRVAAAIPLRVASLDQVARNAGLSEGRTRTVLEILAGKGLVVDLPRDDKPTLYYLNPAIIGFFEFSMMRVRADIDQAKVAHLMWEYLREDPDRGFLRMLANGETFIARPLVDEEALAPDSWTEILDWQRASAIIDEAGSWAEGLCHCRHVKHHLGEPCSLPMDRCLSLGGGADYLVRNHLAHPISRERALEILAEARADGCVQMADNVQRRPTFICNCCGCCCEMLEGMRALPGLATVVTSGWMATVDDERCTGCGKCAAACPVDAIDRVSATPTDAAPRRRQRATVDAQRCLGCGVCRRACQFDGLEMMPSEKRVRTPQDMLEKTLRQAVERGRLPDLLLNDPTKLTHRTLAAALRVVLALPPAAQALASDQLRSRFVHTLVAGFRRSRAGRAAS